jgi:hypothetical protein
MLSRRLLIAATPLALLTGCATRFYDGQSTAPRLQMQNPGLRPPEGALNLDAGLLMPGDIILSAAKGATSLGIRLLTLSAVSHASLYVGDSQVAEAVGEGIRRRAMEQFLDEESTVAAFRHPGVRPEHVEKMQAFVAETVGQKYNFVGVLLQAPFSIERRLCELPLMPSLIRDFCVQGVGALQVGLGRSDRFFCSHFLLEAYRRAGLPLTTAVAQPSRPAAHARGRCALGTQPPGARLRRAPEVRASRGNRFE